MADEGEQGNGLGTKCRSEGPAAAESPELEEIEQQVAAKEAELEAARQRLHEQREWHKRMQSEKMRQKMQELDSEIQSLASGKDDLETRIRQAREAVEKRQREEEELDGKLHSYDRDFKMEDIVMRQIRVDQAKKELEELDTTMLRREAQLEAIAEEQRARAGRRRQRLDAILSDTSELRNALESGALNDEERDRLIEAAVEGGEGEEGQSAMATLARELHAARRVQMADKMQALADETKALNSDRLNLEEARKDLARKKRDIRLLQSKGPEFMLEVEMGHAPPLQHVMRSLRDEAEREEAQRRRSRIRQQRRQRKREAREGAERGEDEDEDENENDKDEEEDDVEVDEEEDDEDGDEEEDDEDGDEDEDDEEAKGGEGARRVDEVEAAVEARVHAALLDPSVGPQEMEEIVARSRRELQEHMADKRAQLERGVKAVEEEMKRARGAADLGEASLRHQIMVDVASDRQPQRASRPPPLPPSTKGRALFASMRSLVEGMVREALASVADSEEVQAELEADKQRWQESDEMLARESEAAVQAQVERSTARQVLESTLQSLLREAAGEALGLEHSARDIAFGWIASALLPSSAPASSRHAVRGAMRSAAQEAALGPRRGGSGHLAPAVGVGPALLLARGGDAEGLGRAAATQLSAPPRLVPPVGERLSTPFSDALPSLKLQQQQQRGLFRGASSDPTVLGVAEMVRREAPWVPAFDPVSRVAHPFSASPLPTRTASWAAARDAERAFWSRGQWAEAAVELAPCPAASQVQQDGVVAAASSPNGALLALGTAKGTVIVWSTASRPLWPVRVAPSATRQAFNQVAGPGAGSAWSKSEEFASAGAVTALAFSRNGQQLAVAHDSGVVRVWLLRGAAKAGRRRGKASTLLAPPGATPKPRDAALWVALRARDWSMRQASVLEGLYGAGDERWRAAHAKQLAKRRGEGTEGMTKAELRGARSTVVAFAPSVTAVGTQPAVVVARRDGLVARWNAHFAPLPDEAALCKARTVVPRGAPRIRVVVGASAAPREPPDPGARAAAGRLADFLTDWRPPAVRGPPPAGGAGPRGSEGEDKGRLGPVRREFSRAHRCPVLALAQRVGDPPYALTLDARGHACLWVYSRRHFSPLGWFEPADRLRLCLAWPVVAPAAGARAGPVRVRFSATATAGAAVGAGDASAESHDESLRLMGCGRGTQVGTVSAPPEAGPAAASRECETHMHMGAGAAGRVARAAAQCERAAGWSAEVEEGAEEAADKTVGDAHLSAWADGVGSEGEGGQGGVRDLGSFRCHLVTRRRGSGALVAHVESPCRVALRQAQVVAAAPTAASLEVVALLWLPAHTRPAGDMEALAPEPILRGAAGTEARVALVRVAAGVSASGAPALIAGDTRAELPVAALFEGLGHRFIAQSKALASAPGPAPAVCLAVGPFHGVVGTEHAFLWLDHVVAAVSLATGAVVARAAVECAAGPASRLEAMPDGEALVLLPGAGQAPRLLRLEHPLLQEVRLPETAEARREEIRSQLSTWSRDCALRRMAVAPSSQVASELWQAGRRAPARALRLLATDIAHEAADRAAAAAEEEAERRRRRLVGVE